MPALIGVIGWAGRAAALGALAAGAAACAPKAAARFVAADYGAQAPARVAVLPFDNQTVDLVGPDMLRKLVQARLVERGFQPLGLDAVDAKLAELGVHEGGQLEGLDPGRIGAAVGAEGLFYGTVEEFTMQNVGFVIRRVVKLRLRLVSAQGGERLWEDLGEGQTGSVTLDKKQAERAFVYGLAEREVENVIHTPLMAESRLAVGRLMSSLPGR